MTLDELVLLFRVEAAKGLGELSKVQEAVSKTNETVTKVSAGFKDFASALSLAAVAMGAYRLAQRQINFGNIATQTNHSIQSVVALSRSFEKIGLSAESAQAAIRSYSDEIGNYQYKGTPSATLNAASALGVAFRDENGKFREAQDLYLDLAQRELERVGGDKQRALQSMTYLRGLNRELAQWALNTTRSQFEVQKAEAAIDKAREAQLTKAVERYKGLQHQIEDLSVTMLTNFAPVANKAFDSFKPVIDLLTSSPNAIENSMKAFVNLRLLAINPLLGILAGIAMWFDKILEFIYQVGDKFAEYDVSNDTKENIKALEKSGTGKLTLSNILKNAKEAILGIGDSNVTEEAMNNLSGWQAPSRKSGILNEREQTFADLLRSVEGGVDKAGGGYNAVNFGQKFGYKGGVLDLSNMTVDEVMRRQRNFEFNAAGKYQFIRDTLPGVFAHAQKLYGVQGSDKFDAKTQDLLFKAFLQQDSTLKKYFDGEIEYSSEVQDAMSKKWASIPHSKTGRSFYDKTGKNRSLITASQLAMRMGGGAIQPMPNLAMNTRKNTNFNISGPITINTRATNAEGIKRDMANKTQIIAQGKAVNSGMAA